MADKEDELLSHDYDGIREYDNNLPRWWVWQFWITIIISVVYVAYYHFGPGISQEALLALEMREAAARAPVAEAQFTEEALIKLTASPEAVGAGKVVFDAKCLPCHGAQGQGIVGPNLTDDYWIHGGKLLELRKTIVEGVPAKGMVPWKGLLTDTEINNVVAFIRTLRGTNPAGAKPAEGDLAPPA